MPEFDHSELGFKYSIPDKITVRQQLEYASIAGWQQAEDKIFKLWDAAKRLITTWESDLVPDVKKLDVDTETNPKVAAMITVVATDVWSHMLSLDRTEKK